MISAFQTQTIFLTREWTLSITEWFQYLIGPLKVRNNWHSGWLSGLSPCCPCSRKLWCLLKSASTLKSSKVMENWKIHSYRQEYGWLTAAPGCLKAALHRHTTYTCIFEGFYLDRSLIGSFATKLTKGLHSQICLPCGSEQDFVQVRLYVLWRTSKGLKSEKAQT